MVWSSAYADIIRQHFLGALDAEHRAGFEPPKQNIFMQHQQFSECRKFSINRVRQVFESNQK